VIEVIENSNVTTVLRTPTHNAMTRTLIVLATLLFLLAGAAASAEEQGFEIVQSPAPAVRVGQRASVSLSLLPRAGHRLLADGPLLVRPSADGATPERPLYRREDAVDPRSEAPRFELTFTVTRPGARLSAHCTFYLCRDGRCRPIESSVSWTLP
jgi:hypothetical protein